MLSISYYWVGSILQSISTKGKLKMSVNGTQSEEFDLASGVPQGWVLYFMFYLADLPVLKDDLIVLYFNR